MGEQIKKADRLYNALINSNIWKDKMQGLFKDHSRGLPFEE